MDSFDDASATDVYTTGITSKLERRNTMHAYPSPYPAMRTPARRTKAYCLMISLPISLAIILLMHSLLPRPQRFCQPPSQAATATSRRRRSATATVGRPCAVRVSAIPWISCGCGLPAGGPLRWRSRRSRFGFHGRTAVGHAICS